MKRKCFFSRRKKNIFKWNGKKQNTADNKASTAREKYDGCGFFFKRLEYAIQR